MPNLLLLTAGTVAILSAAAMLVPRAEATMPMAPASIEIAIGNTTLVEQARMSCTHRRVCRQGAGLSASEIRVEDKAALIDALQQHVSPRRASVGIHRRQHHCIRLRTRLCGLFVKSQKHFNRIGHHE